MIYEIRTYTFKPLRGAEWLALYKTDGLPLQQEFLGQLIGFFTTEIGDISQVVHIWAYQGLDDRLARRDKMAADSRWQEFGRKVKALDILVTMESRILRPTEFSPLK
ncbi:MAG TPA: NIPSNAP family protein [Paraburkholderia sp.]|nr:NIPSNAP family protein [Paraburkholderia sp.]